MKVLYVVGAVAIVACALLTFQRAASYNDPLELWRRTLVAEPENYRAHNYFASALLAADRIEEGMAQARLSVELQPEQYLGHYLLGSFLAEKGQHAPAIEQYQAAVAADPRSVSARVGWGISLYQTGDVPGAIGQYELALQVQPRYIVALIYLANAKLAAGEPAQARAAVVSARQVALEHGAAATVAQLDEWLVRYARRFPERPPTVSP